jgi:conjugative transfer signal peptidase TraF
MKVILLSIMVISVLIIGGISTVKMPIKLVYNGSASAPLGFYWVDQKPIKQNDFVLISLPKHLQDLVERRHYLPPNVPLIKRVESVVGDVICRKNLDITINGVTVAAAKIADRMGRGMPVWKGCYVLSENQVFLLQDHPLSFDGRYFGPMNRSLILGRAIRVQLPWQEVVK